MRVRIAAVVLMAVAGAIAGSFRLNARLSEAWPRYSFEFSVDSGPAKLFFEVPERGRMSITVQKGSDLVQRRVAAGPGPLDIGDSGRFTVVVERDSGDGPWSCRQVSARELVLHKVTGYAGPGCTPRFSFYSADEDETWMFTYPIEELFYVRVIDGGRVVEELDLYDGPGVQLFGAGVHTLEVAAPENPGEFTATLAR
ncbi:hypothetical protein FJY71_03330 [candidate division WOR-3 bacterium]|nr:hypothetical protein [candidate division WOR-3 bacterium]